MSMNLINLENVTKSYLNKVFNFKINQGDKILVIGENGSGKSTLIKLITNYIVNYNGNIKRRKFKISYLEEIIELPMNMKVSNYIKVMCELKKGIVDFELYNNLNIPTDKYIFELSKGNKQKLSILTTFIGKFDMYVLDEPLNGLDDSMINYFINYIKNIKESVLIVTHYPEKYQCLGYKIIKL